MPAWVTYVLKLILSLVVEKATKPVIRWIKDYVAKKKYNDKVDKVVIDETDKRTIADSHDQLP